MQSKFLFYYIRWHLTEKQWTFLCDFIAFLFSFFLSFPPNVALQRFGCIDHIVAGSVFIKTLLGFTLNCIDWKQKCLYLWCKFSLYSKNFDMIDNIEYGIKVFFIYLLPICSKTGDAWADIQWQNSCVSCCKILP